MAQISFTDGVGAATLLNSRAFPHNRFANWTPDVEPVGPSEPTLADGVIVAFRHRTDYVASLEVDKVPASQLAIMVRLKLWLLDGGTVTVTTGDSANTTYTCRLCPGTVPEIQYSDRRRMEYTFAVRLKNTTDAPMGCAY